MQRELWGVTGMTLLSYAGEYMAFTSILAWLNLLLRNNGMTVLQAQGFGFIVSAVYLLLSGVLAVPFGSLADKFGRRNLAMVGCLGAGVAIVAVNATGSIVGTTAVIIAISAILLVVGVGHASYTTSALAYAGDISNEKDVGEIFGLVETAEYAMFMFGTPLGFQLAQLYGNEATFVITGAILGLGALIAYFGMPEKVRSAGSGIQPQADPAVRESRTRILYNAVTNPGVLVSLLSIFFVSIGFTVFRVFLTQYGTGGQPAAFVGPYLVFIMAAASIGAAIPIGRLVDATRKRTIFMIVGFLVEAVSLGLILYAPSAISLILWSLVFGVAIMLVRVPQAVIIAERTVFGNRAGAMGANHGIEHVGYGLGAFSAGFLVLTVGLSALQTFWFFAAMSALFGLALFRLKKYASLG